MVSVLLTTVFSLFCWNRMITENNSSWLVPSYVDHYLGRVHVIRTTQKVGVDFDYRLPCATYILEEPLLSSDALLSPPGTSMKSKSFVRNAASSEYAKLLISSDFFVVWLLKMGCRNESRVIVTQVFYFVIAYFFILSVFCTHPELFRSVDDEYLY